MNFWSYIASAVGGIWSVLSDGFGVLCKSSYDFLKIHAWATGVFLGLLWYCITYVWDAVNWFAENVPLLADMIDEGAITGGQQIPSPLAQGFAIANALLPLTELFGFIIFLLPIWALAVTIRSVKAWIPTLT